MFDRPPQLLPVQLRNFLTSWTGGEASSQSTAATSYTTQPTASVPHYRSFGPMGPYGGSVMPIVMTEPQSPLFAAAHQTPSSGYRNSLSPLHCISTTPATIPPPLAQVLQSSNGMNGNGNGSPVPASASLVQQQFPVPPVPPHSPSHHDHHNRHNDDIHVRKSPLLGEGLPTFTPTLKLPHSTPWR